MIADLAALVLFAFTTSITPGPNNVMLMTSGVNHGLRRTVPHITGVVFGFMLMLALGALGVHSLFAALPRLEIAITAVSVVYLLVLALRIALAPVTRSASGRLRAARPPLTLWAAALFQWVNPKGWVMLIGVVSVYEPLNGTVAVLLAFLLAGVVSSLGWAWFGTVIARFLSRPRQLRVFNVTMAALLVLSLAPAIAALWRAVGGAG